MSNVEHKLRRVRDKAFPLQTRTGKFVLYCNLPLATSIFVLLRRTKLDAVFILHQETSLLSIYYILSFFVLPVITLVYEEWVLYWSRKRTQDNGLETEKQLAGIASTTSTGIEHIAAPGFATVTFPTCLLVFLPCSITILCNQMGRGQDATWSILSSAALIVMVLGLLMASGLAELSSQSSKTQAVMTFGVHVLSIIASQYLLGAKGAYTGIFFARLVICLFREEAPSTSRARSASMWLMAIAGWYFISTAI